jgi:transcription antitermination protein NusB
MADPHDPSGAGTERTYTRRARHLSRPKRDDTDDPRRSRERALKILFQADLRGVQPTELLLHVSRDDEARAMLDEVDEVGELEGGGPAATAAASGERGRSSGDGPSKRAPERPGAAGLAPGDTTEVGSATGGAGGAGGAGRAVETEAQRIWREERERAERVAEVAGESSDAAETAAGADPVDDGGVPPVDGFTRALVEGVAGGAVQIDELIARFARRWTINRMPVVDRTVLRLATYELLHEPTAPAVVINEAVELAKSLSTDDSGRYVNGVLDSIRKDIAASREAASQDA